MFQYSKYFAVKVSSFDLAATWPVCLLGHSVPSGQEVLHATRAWPPIFLPGTRVLWEVSAAFKPDLGSVASM